MNLLQINETSVPEVMEQQNYLKEKESSRRNLISFWFLPASCYPIPQYLLMGNQPLVALNVV